MRVGFEKVHMSTYKKLVRDANIIIRKKSTVQKDKYKKALINQNISVEEKKRKLTKGLHELILHAFSVHNSKKAIQNAKLNVRLIRNIIDKLKTINNYLEENFLKELGIIKKSLIVQAIKSKTPEKFLEKKRGLSKNYIDKIEHTVYQLMKEIIFFDEKLLKKYKKKEIKVTKKEKLEIKDLENILRTQSELLDALEAKIPPPSKIKQKLFKKEIFNKWIPFVFALLSSFEAEYQKEQLIFAKINKNSRLSKKITRKIKHVIKEKEKMLKIRERRALSMKKLGKITDDYRNVFHEYMSAAGL